MILNVPCSVARPLAALFAGAMLFAGAPAFAAEDAAPGKEVPMLTLATGGRLWLEGDSTLHRYRSEAKELRATFQLKEGAEGDLDGLIRGNAVQGFELAVPVKALKSGEEGLDDKLYEALKVKSAPSITFRMDSYEVTGAAAGGTFTVKVHGRLSVAGVERKVDVEGLAKSGAGGLQLTGSVPIMMTHYGIKPPVMMLGALKVDDRVVVKFDVTLRAAPKAS